MPKNITIIFIIIDAHALDIRADYISNGVHVLYSKLYHWNVSYWLVQVIFMHCIYSADLTVLPSAGSHFDLAFG